MTIIRGDENKVDYLLCFDTTGSMSSVVDQVRRKMSDLVEKLSSALPGVRFAIGVNGDYCDEGSTYVTRFLDFTTNLKTVQTFIEKAERTGGGDFEECYELVFREAQDLSWSKDHRKAMVLVADATPHGPNYPGNKKKLNWRTEVEKLGAAGIKLYGVQALDHGIESTKFYAEIARMTGGFHLRLNQFESITQVLTAIGLQQSDEAAKLDEFEQEMKKRGLYNRAIATVFDTLRGRKATSAGSAESLYGKVDGLKLVPSGRFQSMSVPKDVTIADFVRDQGLLFKVGRGFYEFTKRETIQGYKEIVLLDRKSGDMYTGPAAREMLELPEGSEIRISPKSIDKYVVFVQSTSANRKLKGGTRFLYEVMPDWS